MQKISLVLLVAGTLTACQHAPVTPVAPPPKRTVIVIMPPPEVPATPRGALPDIAQGAIKSEPLPSTPERPAVSVPIQPPIPMQPKTNTPRRDGHNMPVVTSLIDQAKQQLRQNKLDDAEQSLKSAQRLAPENPALYAYFTEIALKRQQGAQAEAAARRGLLLATSSAQKKAFWQLILQAGRMQNKTATIVEAERQLARQR